MRLTEHFTTDDFNRTSHSIENVAPPEFLPHMEACANGLEEIRALLGGHPITITSGYRCPALNAVVGGEDNSAHLTGYAADFVCPEFGTPLGVVRAVSKSAIKFDQIIQEGTWVHVSFAPTMRGEVLTKLPGGGYRHGV